jgi:Tfp pilus assembly protein PilN
MRRINLLPPEIAERRRVRQQAALLIVVGVAFVFLLAAIWFVRNLEIGRQEQRLAEARAEAQELEAEIAKRSEIRELEEQVKERQQTLAALMVGDIAWSRLLIELSMIIPGDSWLTSLTAQAQEEAAEGAPAEQPPAEVPAEEGALPPRLGTLIFAANTFDFPGVSKWITRLQGLKSLQNIWVPSATKAQIGTRDVITFTSTADLSPAAESNRFQEETE